MDCFCFVRASSSPSLCVYREIDRNTRTDTETAGHAHIPRHMNTDTHQGRKGPRTHLSPGTCWCVRRLPCRACCVVYTHTYLYLYMYLYIYIHICTYLDERGAGDRRRSSAWPSSLLLQRRRGISFRPVQGGARRQLHGIYAEQRTLRGSRYTHSNGRIVTEVSPIRIHLMAGGISVGPVLR